MTEGEGAQTNLLEARLKSIIQHEADPLEADLVAHFRELPGAEQQALLRYVERQERGIPMRDNAVQFYRDCGMRKGKAKAQAAKMVAAWAKDPGHGPIPARAGR